MPMCEIKLNQILHKNPDSLNCPNRLIINPFIQKYAHIPYSGNYLSQYGVNISTNNTF